MALLRVVSEAVDELFFDGVPGVAVFEEDCEVWEVQGCLPGQIGFDLKISFLCEPGIKLFDFLQDRRRCVFGRYRGEFDYVFVHGDCWLKIE